MNREFLLTKFVCAKCGKNLELSNNTSNFTGQHAPSEPTGAAMVSQVVAVEPCFNCAKPLTDLRRALKVIFTEGGAA